MMYYYSIYKMHRTVSLTNKMGGGNFFLPPTNNWGEGIFFWHYGGGKFFFPTSQGMGSVK